MARPVRHALIGSALAAAVAAAVLAGYLLGRDGGTTAPAGQAAAPATLARALSGYGPGAMGMFPSRWGGTTLQQPPTQAELAMVRDSVDEWLARRGFAGYRVAEVAAFSRNDYVAVVDASGRGELELLADPFGSWLMPEPGPNMMWNTRYGMAAGGGAGELDLARARRIAQRWLDRVQPRRVVRDARAFPGYYTFDVGSGGKTTGMLSVDDATGAVWYHTWHGTFLAEREFAEPPAS